MGLLINMYCEAVRAWNERMGDTGATQWSMFYTGGTSFYDPVDSGGYTIEQLKDRLATMATRYHIVDSYLIVGLIRTVEDLLESFSEDYAKRLRWARTQRERLAEIKADPEQRADFIRRMNQQLAKADEQSGVLSDREPFTDANIDRMIESATEWSQPSLNDQRDRRIALDVWREVTAPVLEPEILELADEEFWSREV